MEYTRIPGAISNGNMSTRQFQAVIMSGTTISFEVAPTTANTQRPIGILQNDPDTSGYGAEVAHSGIAKARYGGSVTQGDELGVDSLGRVVSLGAPGSTGGHAGRYVIGQALRSGTATGIYHIIVQPAVLFTT